MLRARPSRYFCRGRHRALETGVTATTRVAPRHDHLLIAEASAMSTAPQRGDQATPISLDHGDAKEPLASSPCGAGRLIGADQPRTTNRHPLKGILS